MSLQQSEKNEYSVLRDYAKGAARKHSSYSSEARALIVITYR